jgi:hypothetical protein
MSSAREFEEIVKEFQKMDLFQQRVALFTLLGGLNALLEQPGSPGKGSILKVTKNAAGYAEKAVR